MTTFSLRAARIRPGEQFRHELRVEIEPFALAGERYEPDPPAPLARFAFTRTTSGTVFTLGFVASVRGPCFRCLDEAEVRVEVDATEYEASEPDAAEELRTPYIADGVVDLSAWARDAIALELPEQILCRPDCAGLCPHCGAALADGPCGCSPVEPDPRWDKLAGLRDALGG